jgi:hypothetical protein
MCECVVPGWMDLQCEQMTQAPEALVRGGATSGWMDFED